MSFQPYPFWVVQDENGAPVIGAKLKFYLTNTSTPQEVFSDRGRTASLGTEVTVDGAGKAGPIYLATDIAYKVVITDADDNTIETVNDFVAPDARLAGAGVLSRSTCPLDYGAVGDGLNDESEMVQAAIDDATGTVDLAGMVYRCDSTIVGKSGIRLINGAIDVSLNESGVGIQFSGTANTSVTLDATSRVGENVIVVTDGSSFSAGDYVSIRGNVSMWANPQVMKLGERARIASVSGEELTLESSLHAEYLLADDPVVIKSNMLENFSIEDVTVIGSALDGFAGISVSLSAEFAIRNVRMSGFTAGSCIIITNVDGAVIDGCCFDGGAADSSASLSISRSANVTVSSCVSRNNPSSAFGVSAGIFLSWGIHFRDCIATNSLVGFYLSYGSMLCDVSNCSTSYCETGVQDQGSNNSVTGCTFRHCNDYGIHSNCARTYFSSTVSPTTPEDIVGGSGAIYSNNTIELSGASAIHIQPITQNDDPGGPYTVRGNILSGSQHGVTVLCNMSQIAGLDISGNQMLECNVAGVTITIGGSTASVTRMVIADNTINSPSTSGYGISVVGYDAGSVSLATISGNIISGYEKSITTDNTSSVSIHGNMLSPASATGTGVSVEHSTTSATDQKNVDISGNQILNPGTNGIYVDCGGVDLEAVSIRGNKIHGACDYGVKVPSSNGKQVEGVHISSNEIEADYGIFIEADSSPVGGFSQISSNIISAIVSGIYVSFYSNVQISSNNVDVDYSEGIRVDEAGKCTISGNTVEVRDELNGDLANSILVGNYTVPTISCSIFSNQCVGPIKYDGAATGSQLLSISNNSVNSTGGLLCAVQVYAEGTLEGLSISSNNLMGNVTSAMVLVSVGNVGDVIGGFNISGNNIIQADDDAAGISLSGPGTIASGIISGNFIGNGSYGVSESVTTLVNIAVTGNYFSNCAANINGTFTYATMSNAGADAPNLYTA